MATSSLTCPHQLHADLQPGNIMLSTREPQVCDDLVQEEWADPSPRKVVPDRVIHVSRSPDIPEDGRPVICDFGEAKVGPGPFTGEVMPDLYRAPEIILYIPWAEKIDIWSMGLLVSALSTAQTQLDLQIRCTVWLLTITLMDEPSRPGISSRGRISSTGVCPADRPAGARI